MDHYKLNGKVAIVTGSSSGIGRATAILFVQRGAKIVLHGRNIDKLKAAKADCIKAGGKEAGILVLAGDITQQSIRKDIISKTIEKFKKIDILVNNAGVASLCPLVQLTEEAVDASLNLLYKAPLFMTILAAPYLKDSKGCIVNVSSSATNHPDPGVTAYASSKRALETLTEYSALELTRDGVRTNTVRPGMVQTDMVLSLLPEEQLKTFGRTHLPGRLAWPEEIAEGIAYLCSDSASFVTGETLDVAGGRRLQYNSGVSEKDFPSP